MSLNYNNCILPKNEINYIGNKKENKIKLNKRFIIMNHKIKHFISLNWIEWLNKSLSISIHILIMIIFEIYFFFEYVVDIENKTFISKIGDTFAHLETVQLNPIEVEIIQKISENNHYIIDELYSEYIESKKEQGILLHNLFIKSCKITLPFGIISFLLLILSFFNFRYIKWKTVLFENIIMFLVLGLFEYYFFLNIILKYEPVTNEEIKYFMTKHFFVYLSILESINEN
jgi:hypothetical protein